MNPVPDHHQYHHPYESLVIAAFSTDYLLCCCFSLHYSHHITRSTILHFAHHFIQSAASVRHTLTARMTSCRQSLHHFFDWGSQPSRLTASAHLRMESTSSLTICPYHHSLTSLILSGIGATSKVFWMSLFII